MKNKIIGKVINEFAAQRNDLPEYFGDKIYAANSYHISSYNQHTTINGSFIAKKYNAILDTIKEVKGTVYIQPHCIHVTYHNGNFTIGRDLLTDTFLIPLLNN